MRAESAIKSLGRRAITFTNNPLVSIVLSVLLTIALRLLIEKAWPNPNEFWHVWWLRPIGTLFVFLVGYRLYRFRKYYQTAYGLSELGFALTVSWTSIAKALNQQDAASWIAVGVAAYLIVRGFTNYQEGTKKAVAENDF